LSLHFNLGARPGPGPFSFFHFRPLLQPSAPIAFLGSPLRRAPGTGRRSLVTLLLQPSRAHAPPAPPAPSLRRAHRPGPEDPRPLAPVEEKGRRESGHTGSPSGSPCRRSGPLANGSP